MTKPDIPTFDAFMNPLLQALKELGGSGTIEEIDNRVIEITGLSDEQTEVLHQPEKGGGQTEVEYRLAWTRTYLKKYGLLENSSRGVWALTPKGRGTERVTPRTVRRFVQEQARKEPAVPVEDALEEAGAELSWRDELLNTLLEMDASAFERLVQRLLRESGFIQVEVTGPAATAASTARALCARGDCSASTSSSSASATAGRSAPARCATFAAPWWAGPTRAC
jgi:restriction system protein